MYTTLIIILKNYVIRSRTGSVSQTKRDFPRVGTLFKNFKIPFFVDRFSNSRVIKLLCRLLARSFVPQKETQYL